MFHVVQVAGSWRDLHCRDTCPLPVSDLPALQWLIVSGLQTQEQYRWSDWDMPPPLRNSFIEYTTCEWGRVISHRNLSPPFTDHVKSSIIKKKKLFSMKEGACPFSLYCYCALRSRSCNHCIGENSEPERTGFICSKDFPRIQLTVQHGTFFIKGKWCD